MTQAEKEFVEYWKKRRTQWNWAKTFKTGALYYGVPIVLLIDLMNYFVIAGSKYAFISFRHLFELGFNLIWIGALSGFFYGFFGWNSKEGKYRRIIRKDRFED